MPHVLAYLHHSVSGLFDRVAHGFAMSVGWMIARGLGLPAALVGVVVLGLWYWLRRRRAARKQPNVPNNV